MVMTGVEHPILSPTRIILWGVWATLSILKCKKISLTPTSVLNLIVIEYQQQVFNVSLVVAGGGECSPRGSGGITAREKCPDPGSRL